MALSEEEKNIVRNLKASGKTDLEIQRAIANKRSGMNPQEEGTQILSRPSLLSRAVSRTGEIFEEGRKEIAEETQQAGQRVEEAGTGFVGTFVEKPALLLQSVFRGAGTAAKTAGKLIAEPVATGIEATSERISDIPGVQRFASNTFISSALDTVIGGMQQAGESYEQFKQENPDKAKNIEAGVEILLTVLGEKPTQEILNRTLQQTRRLGTKVAEDVSMGFERAGEAVSDIAHPITERVRPIAERVRTNVGEKIETERAIAALPSQTARDAVRQGIDIEDVRFLMEEIPENKGIYKDLVDTAKKFQDSKGRTRDPIEIVGEPIVKRLKELDSERGRIGQALGEEAKNLGVVTQEELVPAVLGELKKVSGLNGLTVDKNGILNFKNTILTTAETAADRKAIQSIYTQATRWGKGEVKHRLRQELFEVLGGKKKSLANITDTQDKAFQAIRKALSDVLETKNDLYKELSNQYRKVIQPLSELRRVMKAIPGADEDILEMQAGILARRLTSTAPSNPKIRSILRELDEATEISGKSAVDTERLQNFYNIISEYYDIAPKTGFRGQIEQAIKAGGGGIVDRIMNLISGVAGQTPAVRQKALENLLAEIL